MATEEEALSLFSRVWSGVGKAKETVVEYAEPAVSGTFELSRRATQSLKDALPPAVQMAQDVAASGSTMAMNATSTATRGVVSAKDAVVAYHVATVEPLLSAGLGYASIWAGSGLVHLRGGLAIGMNYINRLSAQTLELSRMIWAESFKQWRAFTSDMSSLAFDEFLRRNQVWNYARDVSPNAMPCLEFNRGDRTSYPRSRWGFSLPRGPSSSPHCWGGG